MEMQHKKIKVFEIKTLEEKLCDISRESSLAMPFASIQSS
jgi:hypothetical protein